MKPILTFVTTLLLAPLVGLSGAELPATARSAPDPALKPIEDVAGLPRVLLIGDSVSIGYTQPTRQLLAGKANVHRPPTNCSSTGNGLKYLNSWLGEKKWDVIHFNFGLHDAKLPPEGVRHAPPDVYAKNLRELVTQMKASGAKLIFATTTPVPNGGNLRPTRRFGSVDEYNAAAEKVMMASGVAINDLNAAIAPHLSTMQRANDVHFTSEGSALLAKHVAKSIEAQLDIGLRTSASASAARPPNVIFVLADDLGWGDSGHNGHPCARTPHLDQLAADGLVIKNYYANGPVCSPQPHAPLRPQPALREAFRDLNPDPQAFGKWMGDYIEAAKSPAEQMRTYLAAIAELDRHIERLRAELTRLKIADNSILVFSSDNGPEDYHIGNASNAGMGSPGPLRGRKRSLHEGGSRVPFIATWPGRIPVGKVDETTIMSSVDLMPTLAALAGIPCNAPSIDGEDLSGALRGKPATRQRPLYWEWFFEVVGDPAWFAPPLAMRDGPWEFYCDYAGENVQLFDVASDPSETSE